MNITSSRGDLGWRPWALAGCAAMPSPAELDREAIAAMKASFRDQGIAKVDRLDQRPRAGRVLVGQAAGARAWPSASRPSAGERAAGPPAASYSGDWREGEKLAQNGRGMTWTDPSAAPKDNGGNCYNCHQIDKKEISFGTIGPSLWNYGKLRGVKDMADPASAPIVQYTWGKMWNSKAYAACSNMPRFGHMGLLDEEQICAT